MNNYQLINESLQERVTSRLQRINVIINQVANGEHSNYENELTIDDYLLISTLFVATNEIEAVIEDLTCFGKILESLQGTEKTDKAETVEEKAGVPA